MLQAVVLGICLAAFGESAALSQLILINTAVSLFAGLMPVPGGMGVAEAGYTAGLQAIGIPAPIAVGDGHRLPAGHVLPAAVVGHRGHALAAPARVRLTAAPQQRLEFLDGLACFSLSDFQVREPVLQVGRSRGRLFRRREEEVGQVAGQRAEHTDADDDDDGAHDTAGIRDRELVAVADRRHRHHDVPERVRRRRDIRVRHVGLEAEEDETAELEHDDGDEEQHEQCAAGLVLDQAADDVLGPVVPQQPVHLHQSEQAQDLRLLEGQGREEVGPAPVAEEVVGLRRCRLQPVQEVDEEDDGDRHVHDGEDVVQRLVLHQ